MRYPNVEEIKKLTQKLEKQNDISLEEANRIYSLFFSSYQKTKLNEYSSKLDTELVAALETFYKTVARKIEQGCRGIFFFSVPFFSVPFNPAIPSAVRAAINDVKKALGEHAHLEDFFIKLLVSPELYHSFPGWLQKLFTKTDKREFDSGRKEFYVMNAKRPGVYNYPIKTETETQTIAQFMKQFFPAVKTPDKGWTAFQIATGIRDISSPMWVENRNGQWEVHRADEYVIGAYWKRKKVPLILMQNEIAGNYIFTFFTEKDKARLVKDALEIPFEDMIKNALHNNIIDKQTAKYFLDNNVVWEHLLGKFVEINVEYVDVTVQQKMEWEATKETVEDESEWLEEIR